MCRPEILEAQEDRRYGKGNRGSDLPDEMPQRNQLILAAARMERLMLGNATQRVDRRCRSSRPRSCG